MPANKFDNSRYRKSLEYFAMAESLFPYGTQLLSRRPQLGPFGQAPVYYERAKDAHFWDVDGNEFVDTAMAIGPITLGYCYDPVDRAAKAQIDRGVLGSINSPLEMEMANALVEMVPCAEMVKFCKSGGEADAIAVRLARGYTGKDMVLFCGYHGWHDWYLAANLVSGESLDDHLRPGITAKGVPAAMAGSCFPFEYNNLDYLSRILKENAGKVACILMEPSRYKDPSPGYLEGVRQLADDHGCLLIFDEVVTGFRLAAGGAQEHYGVTPDLASFAKGIANGYPLAAVAGKREIMASQIDNFISSTYWSDAVSLAAGIATLKEIREKPVIATLAQVGLKIREGITALVQKHKLAAHIEGHPCVMHLSFDYGELAGKVATLYMQEMIARGVYVSGSIYTCFSHTQEDIEKLLSAADETFSVIARCIEENTIDQALKCEERLVAFRRLV
jgi:glutamate-1-semialdehyde aminotransferase